MSIHVWYSLSTRINPWGAYVFLSLALLEPSTLPVYAQLLSFVERIDTTCAKLWISAGTLGLGIVKSRRSA